LFERFANALRNNYNSLWINVNLKNWSFFNN
jgi:hypothetical protein